MGTLVKTLVIGLIVLTIAGYIGLVVMAGVASSHGVRRVDLPPGSYAANIAEKADYADAYRAPMTYISFKSIEDVAANVFTSGKEVQRTSREVAISGSRGGARYDVSYVLDKSSDPPTITVATAIRLPDQRARIYWFFAQRVHRYMVPFQIDRMASSASD